MTEIASSRASARLQVGGEPARDRRSRAAAMAGAVGVHGAVLIALIAWRGEPAVVRPEPTVAITLGLPEAGGGGAAEFEPVEVVPAPPEPAPPEPALPPPPMPIPSAVPVEVPPVSPVAPIAPIEDAMLTPRFDAEPDPAVTGDVAGLAAGPGSGSAIGGAACPVAESLRAVFEGDARMRGALMRIPRASRSVAEAIMLWDGRWIAPGRVGGAGTVDALRSAIAAALDRAAPECRTAAMAGPVLVPVTDGTRTVVLAFGSGAWRWADLLRKGET